MKILIFIIAVLLVVFGGGCIVVLGPFISQSVETGGGPSQLHSPGVGAPAVILVALLMLASGISSIWALLMHGAGISERARRILLWIDLAALAAVASCVALFMLGGVTPVIVILGTFTLLMALKVFVQFRLLKAPPGGNP